MILLLFMNTALYNLQGFADFSGGSEPPAPTAETDPPDWLGKVAEELRQLGVEPGDELAVIGYAIDSYWARLARVRIIAEMMGWETDPFWLGDTAFQKETLAIFVATGAKAIVAEYAPSHANLNGWHQIKSSNYYIFLLSREGP
jgi:hypothetical protein